MSIQERVRSLVALVERGRFAEAIEQFYGDGVVMRDNLDPPTVGKAANLERERGFERYIARLHESRADAVLVDGDRAVIHWHLDFTGVDGVRSRFDQLALQRWEGGRVVEERFFYDSPTVKAA